MRFDIITTFPEMIDDFIKHSIINRALKEKIFALKIHNLRDFANDKHKTIDDKPFGGGRGMILKVEPLLKAINRLKKSKGNQKQKKSKVILFSPRGKKFSQKMATKWAKLDQLILICGRYEGIDYRAEKHLADEVVSVGDFVLMGGELPSMMTLEAVARLLPNVVGHSESLIEERISQEGFIEYPQYTRPETIEINNKKRKVPKVLMSGNHKEIEKWRQKNSKLIV